MPRVSFLIPVRNGAEYIEGAISSVLCQTFSDFDVHVFDDGSTDDTLARLDRFRDKRLKIYPGPPVGIVRALNRGLEVIDCTYLARMDADDVSLPDRIERQVEFLEFTDSLAVSCQSMHIDEVGNVTGFSGNQSPFRMDFDWCPAREPYLPHPFLLARYGILSELKYRNAVFAEDSDLCWRLSARGPIALHRAVLGHYRVPTAFDLETSLKIRRIQAYFASLAALNAKRVNASRPEIQYPDMDASEGSELWNVPLAYFDEVNARLSPSERIFFECSVAIKFLEIANWRGLSVTPLDVAKGKTALRRLKGSSVNFLEALETVRTAAIRLPALERSISARLKSGMDRVWWGV